MFSRSLMTEVPSEQCVFAPVLTLGHCLCFFLPLRFSSSIRSGQARALLTLVIGIQMYSRL
jgi:hypothetical protein